MPTYTVEQLSDLARDHLGVEVKQRLIVDWTQKGLLDRPKKTGKGRGGGRGTLLGTWSAEQAALFLWILDQRRGVKRVATLCNLPVFMWLREGSAWVPESQVRRAMLTWSGADRAMSRRRALGAARVLVSQLAIRGVSRADRKELVETVSDIAERGDVNEHSRQRLLQAAQAAFLPRDVPIADSRPAVIDPRAWVGTIEARIAVLDRLRRNEPIDFEWGRQLYLSTHADYLARYPEIVAADPEKASRFAPPSLEEIISNACYELLTLLGLADMVSRQYNPSPHAIVFDPLRSPLAGAASAATEEGDAD